MALCEIRTDNRLRLDTALPKGMRVTAGQNLGKQRPSDFTIAFRPPCENGWILVAINKIADKNSTNPRNSSLLLLGKLGILPATGKRILATIWARRSAGFEIPVVVWELAPNQSTDGTLVPSYGTFHSVARLRTNQDRGAKADVALHKPRRLEFDTFSSELVVSCTETAGRPSAWCLLYDSSAKHKELTEET